uniref:Uncharacterized protein n=1 Tax=Tanacetum cinerariifolium TaxID=118510 RepID=A0A699I176_TANCI|nr:hypothetical protein [Tanacetum cinerariifolium]
MSSIPTNSYLATFVFVIEVVYFLFGSGDFRYSRSLLKKYSEGSGSEIVVTGGASVVIDGVRIGVVVYSSTCDMVEAKRGGKRVVAGASEGFLGISERIKGSGIIDTSTVSTDEDWICGISC